VSSNVRAVIGFPEAVKFLREQQNLSARKLSEAAGLSPSYVGKLEKRELAASLQAFARIATVLEMTPAEIWFCVRAES
jgi:transcriptional regulator with XRE-family HTH domain